MYTTLVSIDLDDGWVITKRHKQNGDKGYFYVIYHSHGTQRVPTYKQFKPTEWEKYRCSHCNINVPDEVSGFAELCKWER